MSWNLNGCRPVEQWLENDLWMIYCKSSEPNNNKLFHSRSDMISILFVTVRARCDVTCRIYFTPGARPRSEQTYLSLNDFRIVSVTSYVRDTTPELLTRSLIPEWRHLRHRSWRMSLRSAGGLAQLGLHLQAHHLPRWTRLHGAHPTRDTAVAAWHETDVRRRLYDLRMRNARTSDAHHGGNRNARALCCRRSCHSHRFDDHTDAAIRFKGEFWHFRFLTPTAGISKISAQELHEHAPHEKRISLLLSVASGTFN